MLIYKEFAYNVPPIPAPPATVNAPVVVEVAVVKFVIEIALVVVAPLLDTESNVLVFHTITVPVFELTLVSVPAVNVCTPKLIIPKEVAVPVDINPTMPIYVLPVAIIDVTTLLLLSYTAPAYKLPLIPTPPATVNAPLVADVDDTVLSIEIATVVDEPC